MGSPRVDEALRSVTRLRQQIEALDLSPTSPPKRPFLHDEESGEVIARIGDRAGPITFFVGAGASIEAQLPSWLSLVRRLLPSVVLPPRVDREEWATTLLENGPTAAAAVVQARVGDRFPGQVFRALYGGKHSRVYRPGALAGQIAYWRAEFGDAVSLLTVNYDDMIEKALRSRGLQPCPISAEGETAAKGEVAVFHLHGRLNDDAQDLPIVLSEDDYARFPVGESWQDALMDHLLATTMCVFVGLSFTDPNLLRWLHTADSGHNGHVALFSRQSSPRLSDGVRAQLEHATRERWRQAHVDVFFTDFFGEQAQILHEAALRRSSAGIDPFETRADAARDRAREFFGLGGDFAAGQLAASEWLRSLLADVRTILRGREHRLHEKLGLGLWVADHAEGQLVCLGTSDRAHADPRTLVPVPLELVSDWTSVEAVTNGSPRFQDPAIYASRWRYVRGLPLVFRRGQPGRVLVGAITLTSTKARANSVFARAADPVLDEVDDLLTDYGALAFDT